MHIYTFLIGISTVHQLYINRIVKPKQEISEYQTRRIHTCSDKSSGKGRFGSLTPV